MPDKRYCGKKVIILEKTSSYLLHISLKLALLTSILFLDSGYRFDFTFGFGFGIGLAFGFGLVLVLVLFLY